MTPEQQPGENVFEYILRAAQWTRDNRHQLLREQCQRIEHKARTHGNQEADPQEARTSRTG